MGRKHLTVDFGDNHLAACPRRIARKRISYIAESPDLQATGRIMYWGQDSLNIQLWKNPHSPAQLRCVPMGILRCL
jgi:hypothetical protein